MNGRITYLSFDAQGLPQSGGLPVVLLGLTGLTGFKTDTNNLVGSIPSGIGSLTALTFLSLAGNQFTGPVPQEMLQLKKLTYLSLDSNPHLTGKLPAFNFAQFTQCCVMNGDSFVCPLPEGADKCVGGPFVCDVRPAPTCK
jgi:hypothetical protein